MNTKKHFLFLFVSLLITTISVAQISTPEKRKVNLGIYLGGNVIKYAPFIASDLSLKNTQFRLLYFYFYNPKTKIGKPTLGAGITQEIAKTSVVFYNIKWIASSYLIYDTEYNRHAPTIPNADLKSTILSGILTTGLKGYFFKNMYSILQGGVSVSKYTTAGYANETEIHPFFEFGVGLNLFQTYTDTKGTKSEE